MTKNLSPKEIIESYEVNGKNMLKVTHVSSAKDDSAYYYNITFVDKNKVEHPKIKVLATNIINASRFKQPPKFDNEKADAARNPYYSLNIQNTEEMRNYLNTSEHYKSINVANSGSSVLFTDTCIKNTQEFVTAMSCLDKAFNELFNSAPSENPFHKLIGEKKPSKTLEKIKDVINLVSTSYEDKDKGEIVDLVNPIFRLKVPVNYEEKIPYIHNSFSKTEGIKYAAKFIDIRKNKKGDTYEQPVLFNSDLIGKRYDDKALNSTIKYLLKKGKVQKNKENKDDSKIINCTSLDPTKKIENPFTDPLCVYLQKRKINDKTVIDLPYADTVDEIVRSYSMLFVIWEYSQCVLSKAGLSHKHIAKISVKTAPKLSREIFTEEEKQVFNINLNTGMNLNDNLDFDEIDDQVNQINKKSEESEKSSKKSSSKKSSSKKAKSESESSESEQESKKNKKVTSKKSSSKKVKSESESSEIKQETKKPKNTKKVKSESEKSESESEKSESEKSESESESEKSESESEKSESESESEKSESESEIQQPKVILKPLPDEENKKDKKVKSKK